MTVHSVPDLAFTAAIDREARRAHVVGEEGVNGIDYVEVLSNHPGTPGEVPLAPAQRTLVAHLLNDEVPADWDASRVVIVGGVRVDAAINPVSVEWAYPAVKVAATGATEPLPGVDEADRELVRARVDVALRPRALVVRTSSSGDWSTYTMRLLDPAGAAAPVGFDLPLASAPFTFTVDCVSDLDCRIKPDCPPDDATSGVLDYLARDYEALRTRLLDRMSTLLPDWRDRSPADPGVMIVELFASLGDRLAYWQDAAAVEAYLGSARRRTSVRRHARMLNYPVHEGCSARTWLAFTTDTDITAPAGTPVADLRPPGSAGQLATALDASEAGAVVFETCVSTPISPARNTLPLFAWSDPEHCLAVGATSAFVTAPSGIDPELTAGDVLILAARPADGTPLDGDPALRFAVRLDRPPVRQVDLLQPSLVIFEIHWHGEDALPAPLPVTTRAQARPLAVALANVTLADHGASVRAERLEPAQVPVMGDYSPRLARTELTFADRAAGLGASPASASSLTRPDPRTATAQVTLHDGERRWAAQSDLLASGRLSADFVVEPEPGGVARLRFGDGLVGRRPGGNTIPLASYRVGTGQRGNVAAGRLTIPLRLSNSADPWGTGAQVEVWNPLPGSGGAEPESLDQVRQLAPSAFRHQLRAVTADDYAAVAMLGSGVQRAVARRRWTGSWFAQEVTIDPVAARADDATVTQAVAGLLEVRRMAGVDVELARPVYVPLHVVLTGCVTPGYLRPDVARQLIDVLSARVLPDGRRGFFHPDEFTFGQPLFLSDLVAAAMAVRGVSWVELSTFSRMGATPRDAAVALDAGRLDAAAREVFRCDSDPNNPEAGQVEIVLGGGS